MTSTAVQTRFTFTLPIGYVDDAGVVHRHGTMRLATARDEIMPLRDPRVRDNEAYLTVLLLARVITELGSLDHVDAGVIEGMFSADLAALQELYRRINADARSTVAVVCPGCGTEHDVDLSGGPPGRS